MPGSLLSFKKKIIVVGGGGSIGSGITFDPTFNAGGTLSNGNKTYVWTDYTNSLVRTFLGKTSGKYYCEFLCSSVGPTSAIDVGVSDESAFTSQNAYSTVGMGRAGGTTGWNIPANSLIGVEINIDARTCYYTTYAGDGSVFYEGFTAEFPAGKLIYPTIGDDNGGGAATVTINCGATAFNSRSAARRAVLTSGGYNMGFGDISGSPITWDPFNKSAAIVLSNGNKTLDSGQHNAVKATRSKLSGKWYWEIFNGADPYPANVFGIGTAKSGLETYVGSDSLGFGLCPGQASIFGSGVGYPAGGTNTTYGFNLDCDAKTLTIKSSYGANVTVSTAPLVGALFPMASVYSGVVTANFGSAAWTLTPNAGHVALT